MTRTAKKHVDIDLYDDLERIKESLAAITQDVKAKTAFMLDESLEKAKEKSADIKDQVDDLVASKPLKSLGIALIAGVFIGYLLHK